MNLLTVTQICGRWNCHPTTVERWIARGEFPPPDKKGGGPKGWRYWDVDTVDNYFERKKTLVNASKH